MKKHNTLLAGVVYKGAEPFLPMYFDSIKKQSDKNFDVLIINDGLGEEKLDIYEEDINVLLIKEKCTFARIRQKIIEYACENQYANLIFSDTDDFFSEQRIELSIKYLKKYDFVLNELHLVDENNLVIQPCFLSGIITEDELSDYTILLDKNIAGMSNTAVNVNAIKKIIIPNDVIAVDWYLFSCMLLNKCKGKFITHCTTFYRQHDGNLVGMKGGMNNDKLMFGIEVKKKHFSRMKEFCIENKYIDAALIYTVKLDEMIALEKKISESDFKQKYIKAVNQNYDKIFSGWWSDIININEYQTYAN
ncbi:MAG: hypothetical protein HY841_11265 [Bacteroidetes bacterium]|nr:hypothetical protein [Bacteroidota bacterium]